MNAVAQVAQKVWTEAELEALPEDGFSHEVVNGELVMSPKNNFWHGDICMRLSTALNNFVTAHRLASCLIRAPASGCTIGIAARPTSLSFPRSG